MVIFQSMLKKINQKGSKGNPGNYVKYLWKNARNKDKTL